MPFRAASRRNSANASGGSYSKVAMRPAIRRSGVFGARSAAMRHALERIVLQLADGLPHLAVGQDLDRLEPGIVQPSPIDGEHHPRGHARRPEAQMPVADRGVDEADLAAIG